MPLVPRKAPKMITLDTVAPREVDWLWYPYLPLGAAAMLFGPGGHGKSTIAVDLAAKVSTGQPFPGHVARNAPLHVLMLSAEDEADVVLVPRLIKAGADLTRVHNVETFFTLDMAGLKWLEGMIVEAGATLIIVDPIVAYMGGKIDMNKANEVREMMGEVHRMARRHNVSILIIHHSRKGRDGNDFERAMGSADFNNAVRSVLYTDRADEGDRIMRHVKTNYGPIGDPWAYKLSDNGIEWLDSPDDTAMQVRQQSRGAKFLDAQQFLLHFLASGRASATEVVKIAEQEGYTKATIQRAKKGLVNSVAVKVGERVVWYWELNDNAMASMTHKPKDQTSLAPAVEPTDDDPDLPRVDVQGSTADGGGGREADGPADTSAAGSAVGTVRKLGSRGTSGPADPFSTAVITVNPQVLAAMAAAHKARKAL